MFLSNYISQCDMSRIVLSHCIFSLVVDLIGHLLNLFTYSPVTSELKMKDCWEFQPFTIMFLIL